MKYDEMDHVADYLSNRLAVVINDRFDGDVDNEEDLIDEIFPWIEAAYRSAYLRGRFDAAVEFRNSCLDMCEAVDQDAIGQVQEVFGANDEELKNNSLAVEASFDLIPGELHGWFAERIY